jgi:dephospho-CoA kinase
MKPARTFTRFSVGVTGGIGCGKTTVTDMFAQLGASLIDTDIIAHQLTAPGGAAIARIAAEFGPEFINQDGALDRSKMRELVFTRPDAKNRLEAILHPMIGQETIQQASQAQGVYLMFIVPLLVESRTWKEKVDRVLVIDCPETLQVTRVMARNGMTETQVRAIMATQASRTERLAAADDVIRNQGEIAALTAQVAHLHQEYCAFSQST